MIKISESMMSKINNLPIHPNKLDYWIIIESNFTISGDGCSST